MSKEELEQQAEQEFYEWVELMEAEYANQSRDEE